MSSALDVIKTITKKASATTVKLGSEYSNCMRLATGVFEVDYATGGGFPCGRISIVYGLESSNKTNLCLLTAARDLKRHPDKYWVFVDVENHFDPIWAKRLGVPVDRLIVVKPEYAEQAVDICDAFLRADDIRGLIVDSLAALIPESEKEATAERTQVGGNSIVIGKLMRKVTSTLLQVMEEDRYPTVICINQVRMKIGVMFGDPETQAGGNSVRFQSGLTIRLYGKDKQPKGYDVPCLKETKGILKKCKVPVLNKNPEFDMVVLPYETYGIGQTVDWNFLREHLKDLGWLVQEGKKWIFDEQEFAKQDDVQPYIYEDLEFMENLKESVIKARMIQLHGEEAWVDYD